MRTAIKAILLVSCLTMATWLTYKIHGSPKVGVDDANIFFSYSENLASGNGITYAHNADRVEGATSMLWMLICAFIFWLGLKESAVLFFSVLLLSLTQWLLFRTIQHYAEKKHQQAWPYQFAYLTLILCSPAYITWMTITLMDTCLWGLIIVAMTYVVLSPPLSPKGQIAAAMPFILAPISRPEGMLVAPVLIALLWLRSLSSGSRPQTRFCIGAGCAMLLSLAALTTFRLIYFGYPLPNTYYAKVSPSIAYNLRVGINYLYGFTTSSTIIGGLLAIVLFACASWIGHSADRMRSRRSIKPLLMNHIKASETTALVALILLFIPVLTGGDHFPLFRFYQPVYPILCITLVLLLLESSIFDFSDSRKLLDSGGTHAFQTAAVGIALAYWLFACSFDKSWNHMLQESPIAIDFWIAKRGINRGTILKTLFAKRERFPAIGVISAGGIARTYPGPIVDLMGLNNKYIAHIKGNRKGKKNHAAFEKDTFFKIEPDILLAFPPVPTETNNFCSVCLKGLFEDTRFATKWRYGILQQKEDYDTAEKAFFKKTFLDDLHPDTGLEFYDTMIWSDGIWTPIAKTSSFTNTYSLPK